MDIVFNIAGDHMICDGATVPLDRFRNYLLRKWEPLVSSHLTKAITGKRRVTRFIYDWASVFSIAHSSGYIMHDFLKTLKPAGSPEATPVSRPTNNTPDQYATPRN